MPTNSTREPELGRGEYTMGPELGGETREGEIGGESEEEELSVAVSVRIQSSVDIVVARQEGRALASRLGFSSTSLTVIATAISEVARNIVEYANEGQVSISLIDKDDYKGVQIVATDRGPGISDVETAMRDGYSTGRGMGIGLPGARRLMDVFEIASEVGKGTTVRMVKWSDQRTHG